MNENFKYMEFVYSCWKVMSQMTQQKDVTIEISLSEKAHVLKNNNSKSYNLPYENSEDTFIKNNNSKSYDRSYKKYTSFQLDIF